MKTKKNAREKRAEETRAREARRTQGRTVPSARPAEKTASPAKRPDAESVSPEELARRQEEETREFLEYLEKHTSIVKEEAERKTAGRKTVRRPLMGVINLEEGMPTVEEALRRMSIGLQEMRISGVRLVRLIHGYGSTGRGGKIRAGVRQELERMRKRRGIGGYVPGEEFGPYSGESRRMADLFPEIVRDPEYGRGNQGITIVMLPCG